MNIQKNLKVSILGKTYVIATDEDDAHITQAAELVHTLMKAKIEKSSTKKEEKIAIIVALQLATDLIKKQQELKRYEHKTSELACLITQEEGCKI